jgi:protein-S-isoprenylcysteine O-methyltransferase Ste14
MAVGFVGLILRARREEQALAAEFGAEWDAYCHMVPAWIPRFRKKAESAEGEHKRK